MTVDCSQRISIKIYAVDLSYHLLTAYCEVWRQILFDARSHPKSLLIFLCFQRDIDPHKTADLITSKDRFVLIRLTTPLSASLILVLRAAFHERPTLSSNPFVPMRDGVRVATSKYTSRILRLDSLLFYFLVFLILSYESLNLFG